MTQVISLKDLPLHNKKVLVRVDFNVPLEAQGVISDNSRIVASLPTIRYLLAQGCSIVLMSHLGRPKGKFEKEFSLKPVADELQNLLGMPVFMAPDCVGSATSQMAEK